MSPCCQSSEVGAVVCAVAMVLKHLWKHVPDIKGVSALRLV